jgi:hypothetical protein
LLHCADRESGAGSVAPEQKKRRPPRGDRRFLFGSFGFWRHCVEHPLERAHRDSKDLTDADGREVTALGRAVGRIASEVEIFLTGLRDGER